MTSCEPDHRAGTDAYSKDLRGWQCEGLRLSSAEVAKNFGVEFKNTESFLATRLCSQEVVSYRMLTTPLVLNLVLDKYSLAS